MVAAPPPPIVRFARLPPGWRQFGVRFPSNSETIATSWAYRASRLGPAARMPRDATMIDVLVYRRASNRPGFTERCGSLRLPRSSVGALEGAPDTPEYRVACHTFRFDLDVRVDIRRRQPTRRQFAAAQLALSRLRLPP